MKYKRWITGAIIAFIFLSFFIYKNESFEIIYIKLFKKTLSIVHKNAQGQMNGKATFYKEGKIVQEANFVDGLRNGYTLTYYNSGRIQSKIFYKNDKEDGEEFQYYENGNVRYEGNWIKGRRYGSLLYHDKNDKILIYHAYDILGNKFNVIWLDQSGDVTKHQGYIVSNRMYSINSDDNSLTLLDNGKVYSHINDLIYDCCHSTEIALIHLNYY